MSLLQVNWNPDRRQLRSFAGLWILFFGVMGVYRAWTAGAFHTDIPLGWHDPWRVPLLFWTVAAVIGGLGVVVPSLMRPIYVGWMVLAFPIGWVVSHVLLGVIYFGLFSLIGLVFKLGRRDALSLTFDRGASSYWVPRPPPAEGARYFKQF
jgi:hypothetical protein